MILKQPEGNFVGSPNHLFIFPLFQLIRHRPLRHRGRRRFSLNLVLVGIFVLFSFATTAQSSAGESLLRRRRSEDEVPHQNQVEMGEDTLMERSGLSDMVDRLTDRYQSNHILVSPHSLGT